MKYIILFICMLLFCTGCISSLFNGDLFSSKKPKDLKEENENLKKQIKEQKKIVEDLQKNLSTNLNNYSDLQSQTAIFIQLKSFLKELNYRKFGIIKSVSILIYDIIKSAFHRWGADFLWAIFFIALFTELCGYLKLLPVVLLPGIFGTALGILKTIFSFNKLWTSLLVAGIISVIASLFISCSWGYFQIIYGAAWGVSTVAWEYIVNKTGIGNKVKIGSVAASLAKKLTK